MKVDQQLDINILHSCTVVWATQIAITSITKQWRTQYRMICLTRLLNFHVLLVDTQLIIILSIGNTRHSIDNFHVITHKTIYMRRYAQCNVTFQVPLCSSATQYPCLIWHFDIADYTRRAHTYIPWTNRGACIWAVGFDRDHVFLRIS